MPFWLRTRAARMSARTVSGEPFSVGGASARRKASCNVAWPAIEPCVSKPFAWEKLRAAVESPTVRKSTSSALRKVRS